MRFKASIVLPLLLLSLITFKGFSATITDENGVIYTVLSEPTDNESGICEVGKNTRFEQTKLTIPYSVFSEGKEYVVKYIGEKAFDQDNYYGDNIIKLSTIDLTQCKELEEIKPYAFRKCRNLISVNLRGLDKLKTINKHAFKECDHMVAVDFTGCSNLEIIGEYSFALCSVLKDILGFATLTSLREIQQYAFWKESALEKIDLTECKNLELIGLWAFQGDFNLISLGDLTNHVNLKKIATQAFYGCRMLSEIDLSGCTGLEEIWDEAFRECSALTSVNLKDCMNIKAVGSDLFYECPNVKSFTIEALTPPAPRINLETYKYTSALYKTFDENGTLYVPASSLDLYNSAWGWKEVMDIRAIGDDDNGEEDDELDENTFIFNDLHDAWLSPSISGQGKKETIELQKDYYGLIGFEFEPKPGYIIDKATIYIVTERPKINTVYLYSYGHDFDELEANWGDEEEYINEAMNKGPLMEFRPDGQWNKAIWECSEDYQDYKLWVNELDITDYLRTFESSTNRVNFLLNGGENNSNSRFYTKDNEGIKNSDGIVSWAQSVSPQDLTPYLKVVFRKIEKEIISAELNPFADTWIYNKDNSDRSADSEMEIYANDEKELYGLMSFSNLPSDIFDSSEYFITDVTLRLTCTFLKPDNRMEIYNYPHNFGESGVTFVLEEEYVREALSNDPVVSFNVNGQVGKAPKYDDVNQDMKDVTAWQNYIDMTEYVRGLVENYDGDAADFRFNILFNKPDNSEATKFATKDAVDYTTANGVQWKKEDLIPVLTINYIKRASRPIHSTQVSDLADFITFDVNEDLDLYYYHFIYNPSEYSTYAKKVNGTDDTRVFAKATINDPNVENISFNDDGTKTYKFITDNLVASANNTPKTSFKELTSSEILHISTYTQDPANDGNQSDETTVGVTNDSNGGSLSGVEDISISSEAHDVEYFNLQGMRVANPSPGNIYIMRKGAITRKIIFN